MAAITVTAANVNPLTGATTERLTCGEATGLTQGKAYYIKAADGKAYLADWNNTSAEAAARGIVFTPAAQDEIFLGVSAGDIDVGATLTVGETYIVGDAGAINPVADVSTNFVTILGIATAPGVLNVQIHASGIQHA